MKIDNEGMNIEVILEWEDWERLEKGATIGDRYDGENKLLIHLSDSSKSQYAEFDRGTMDIDVYIPHEVLKDTRISASRFSEDMGNLKIAPNSDFCEDMNIRISYPGSLKVVDVMSHYY